MIHFYSTRNLPAITDVSRDSIRRGGGSVCGSDVGGVVGAAAMKKAMNDVSSDNLQRHLQVLLSWSSCIMSDTSPSKMVSKLFQEYTTT